MFGIQDGLVIPFAPPAINGLGNFGGFSIQILDQSGRGDIQELGTGTQAFVGASQQSQIVTGMFSGFTPNDPQLAVDIDREKARSVGLPISEITSAMQIYLGSSYVNDFDFNNRAYRVYVQADKAFRSDPRDLGQYYARTERGEMVPLASVVRVRETTGPQVISHFNLFRSAEVSGAAAPGFSSGQAIAEAERSPRRRCAWLRLRVVGDLVRGRSPGGGQSARDLRIGLLLVTHPGGAVESFVRRSSCCSCAAGDVSGRSRHSGCAACRTISTARSGS